MLTPGQQIGEFRIERMLGQGGMGAVYVATQLSTGRQRALKALHARFASHAGYMERFVAEARVGSHIQSEHVVEVVAAGVDQPTGTAWLAMELLEGMSLDELIASRGPLAPHEVVQLFEQTCHGLAAAHAAGIVHRDLKPENLFIAKSRRVGLPFVVKILDFGIAKWTQESMTSAGSQAIGTPFWMAPEQSQLSGRIGPRTDIWALGLLAFYALTGRPYWYCAQPNVTSTLPQFLAEALMQDLEAPSVRAARFGIGLPVSPHFDAWFGGCLARDPQHRYESVEQCMNGLLAAIMPRSAPTSPMGTMPMVAVPLPPPQAWTGPSHAGMQSHPGSHAGYTPPAPSYASPAPAYDASFQQPPSRTGLYVAGGLAALMATLAIGGGALYVAATWESDDDDDDAAPVIAQVAQQPMVQAPPDDGFQAALDACEAALREQNPQSATEHAQRALSIRAGDASATSCRDRAGWMSSERATFDEGSLALGRGDHLTAYSTFTRLPAQSPFRARPEVGRAAEALAEDRLVQARVQIRDEPADAFLTAREVRRMELIGAAQISEAFSIESQARDRSGTIYEGRVTQGTGIEGAQVCSVVVQSVRNMPGLECRLRIRCGGRMIYGHTNTGYVRDCRRADGRITFAHDSMESRVDTDPATRFDLEGRSVTIRDGSRLDVALEIVDP